jgi:hypothetical protein
MVEVIKVEAKLLKGKAPALTPTPGTWICGGAIRQWFTGKEKPSDIDVFAQTKEAHDNFVETRLKDALIIHATANAVTYRGPEGQPVQLIKVAYYQNLHDILDSFDFNVCQFGWDGTTVYSTTYAIWSVLQNHLGVHKLRPEFAADSLRRAFKYHGKGFKPCAGTLRDLGQNFAGLSQQQIDDQVSISPNGGRRIVGID